MISRCKRPVSFLLVLMLVASLFSAVPMTVYAATTAPTRKTDLVYNGNPQALISSASTDFGTLQYGFSRTPVVYENCVVNIADLKFGDILYVHDSGEITFSGEGAVKQYNEVITRIWHDPGYSVPMMNIKFTRTASRATDPEPARDQSTQH